MRPTLSSLPPEILSAILSFSDHTTVLALSQTSRHFHAATSTASLWANLLLRRFRQTPRFRPGAPRRPQDTFRQWHRQQRIPLGRAGAIGIPFAKAQLRDARAWLVVNSAADCRLGREGLRVKVVVQNTGSRDLKVFVRKMRLVFVSKNETGDLGEPRTAPVSCEFGGGGASSGIASGASGRIAVAVAGESAAESRSAAAGGSVAAGGTNAECDVECEASMAGIAVVDRAGTGGCGVGGGSGVSGGGRVAVNARASEVLLARDDYYVAQIAVKMLRAVHEVDALERIVRIEVDVEEVGDATKRDVLTLVLDHDTVWDAYDYMPGGWWVRKDDGERRGDIAGL